MYSKEVMHLWKLSRPDKVWVGLKEFRKMETSTTGINELDRILGNLVIGDNVLWYDNAGSQAIVFALNFIRITLKNKKSLVYVSFDKSPRYLLEKLGAYSENQNLIILDCFTEGIGSGEDVFSLFYEEYPKNPQNTCRFIKVGQPAKREEFLKELFRIHGELDGVVHYVFDSITGMRELWKSEDEIVDLYSRTCPRLYELKTIAYWIMEKNAHSEWVKAHIAKIAQVVVDLSLQRGKTTLKILKSENTELENLDTPFGYWSDNNKVSFNRKRINGQIDLGGRLKELRKKRGFSQTELARLVGVTPSTISQVESNQIYPSLQALYKITEILSVDMSSFFSETDFKNPRIVFPLRKAIDIQPMHVPKNSCRIKLLTPLDFTSTVESYYIEIYPNKILNNHFFINKVEEIGHVLAGRLQVRFENRSFELKEGDTIHITNEIPIRWENAENEMGKLLWFLFQ